MERRLTTILAADVVGYSRLMGVDEAGTLATLKAHRTGLIDPKAAQFGGRIIKLMGDGILMEFASVVDAVNFAVDVQHALRAGNDGVPEDRQICYRVGINIGDVIVEGDDIYGDGVNVAARLEGLADAGGVCIGLGVRDQIRDKLDLNLEDLGDVEVKNIARPVRAFRIVMDDKVGALSTPVVRASAQSVRPSRKGIAAVMATLLLVVSGAVLWWQQRPPEIEPARVEAMALPLPDKPSIAVLPFNNMSEDAGQEYFADGMTEDLITDLSKISGLFVIARNSTFVYKGTSVKIKKVAEELGVRYVLEGSVRRVGDQLRVNAQLIDATTGGHVWADRFDGNVTDIFAVQDKFVLKIVSALTITLTEAEISEIEKGDTDEIEAREAFQRGWELYSNFNAKDNAAAVSHFERAIELDPEYDRAYGALAMVYYNAQQFYWFSAIGYTARRLFSDLIPAQLKKAKQHPTVLTHVVVAKDHMYFGRTNDALVEAGRALALQPSDPEAHITMAWAMITSGKPKEGLNFVQAAMRLNPNYPSHYVFARGIALFATGDLQQAASIFREGMERNPRATELTMPTASILAQLQLRQEARELVLKWRPNVSQLVLQNAPDSYEFGFRWAYEHRRVRERLLDGLRLAVLPLETTIPSLVKELSKSNALQRRGVVRTLGLFGPAAAVAVPELIEALGDEDENVRKQAAISLGKVGPGAEAAIAALTAIKSEPIIGFYAKDALTEIIGK